MNHELLLQKLEILCFRGIAYQLLKSYLDNRVQRVSIGDAISSPIDIQCGVPEGTVLGPVLFLIYINDLFCLSYCDDTAIILSAKSWDDLLTDIQSTLKNINCWMDLNALSLNWEKTKCLPFYADCRTKPQFESILLHSIECQDVEINCNCQTKINLVNRAKYLGVLLDSNMKFDSHIEITFKKLSKSLFILKKLQKCLNQQNLKKLYHALFESILQYGFLVWGSSYGNVINPIETLQKSNQNNSTSYR